MCSNNHGHRPTSSSFSRARMPGTTTSFQGLKQLGPQPGVRASRATKPRLFANGGSQVLLKSNYLFIETVSLASFSPPSHSIHSRTPTNKRDQWDQQQTLFYDLPLSVQQSWPCCSSITIPAPTHPSSICPPSAQSNSTPFSNNRQLLNVMRFLDAAKATYDLIRD